LYLDLPGDDGFAWGVLGDGGRRQAFKALRPISPRGWAVPILPGQLIQDTGRASIASRPRSFDAHLYRLEERRLAVGTVVTQICALRFFCRSVLKRRDVREDLPCPKQRLRLPVVLRHDEVQRLIASAKNLYHRTLLLTRSVPARIDPE